MSKLKDKKKERKQRSYGQAGSHPNARPFDKYGNPIHSRKMRRVFGEIESDGVDLPFAKKETEIKETHSGKAYMVRPKDKKAEQILFYNHITKEYSIIPGKEFQRGGNIPIKGERTIRESQVKKYRTFHTTSNNEIYKKIYGIKRT